MRFLKKVITFLVLLCISVLLAAIYLSSGNLSEESYNEVVDYAEPYVISDSTLSVMTFNIGYLSGLTNNQSIRREKEAFESHLSLARKLVQEVDAGIIGFQEIDFGASRSFDVNQLDSLAMAGDYTSAYRSINWDKKYVPFPYWPPSNHFGQMLSGQAILSQFSMESDQTIILNPNLNAPAYYRAFYLDRLLQIINVHFLGTKVKIMNVHLEAFDKETRLKQTEIVKLEFEKYAANQPVVLMGDFNSMIPNLSEEPDAIDLLMDAKWIASAVPFDQESINRTFPSNHPERMIDYIFYNENFFHCTKSNVLQEAGQISDHLPVWAEFKLIGNSN